MEEDSVGVEEYGIEEAFLNYFGLFGSAGIWHALSGLLSL